MIIGLGLFLWLDEINVMPMLLDSDTWWGSLTCLAFGTGCGLLAVLMWFWLVLTVPLWVYGLVIYLQRKAAHVAYIDFLLEAPAMELEELDPPRL